MNPFLLLNNLSPRAFLASIATIISLIYFSNRPYLSNFLSITLFKWLHIKKKYAKKYMDTVESNDKNTSNVTDDEGDLDSTIHIYFGSQTGTAESFAQRIASELELKFQIIPEVHDFENFEVEEFVKHKWVVITISTYGEGDPPDNAEDFYSWLLREPNSEILRSMNFTIMGLGSTHYEAFNKMSKITEFHMLRLGGMMFHKRGEGDDAQDIEGDFSDWLNTFWPAFEDLYFSMHERPTSVQLLSDQEPSILSTEPEWKSNKRAVFDMLVNSNDQSTNNFSAPKLDGCFGAHTANVIDKYELRQTPDYKAGKSTVHLDIDISTNSFLHYNTADTIEIFPHNPSWVVDWWIERIDLDSQGLTLEDRITLVQTKKLNKQFKTIPPNTPIKDIFYQYVDLLGVPPKSQLRDLSCFITDSDEKKAFLDLLSDDFNFYWKIMIKNFHITLIEFVQYFMTSAHFPFEALLQIFPKQRPRSYTIASSSIESPRVISILVSHLGKSLPLLRTALRSLRNKGFGLKLTDSEFNKISKSSRYYDGICSTYLCSDCYISTSLNITIKPSRFKLPSSINAPIIMIGSGAGVAPFRAFWREIYYIHSNNSPLSIPASYAKETQMSTDSSSNTSELVNKHESSKPSLQNNSNKLVHNDKNSDASTTFGSNQDSSGSNNNLNEMSSSTDHTSPNGTCEENTISTSNDDSKANLTFSLDATVFTKAEQNIETSPRREQSTKSKEAYNPTILNKSDELILFFGCQHPDKDWLYKNEMNYASHSGLIDKLIVAFSRHTNIKSYVQYKMNEEWDLVGKHLLKGAYVYICGSTQMGKDVMGTLKSILEKHNCDIDTIDQILDSQKIIKELWG